MLSRSNFDSRRVSNYCQAFACSLGAIPNPFKEISDGPPRPKEPQVLAFKGKVSCPFGWGQWAWHLAPTGRDVYKGVYKKGPRKGQHCVESGNADGLRAHLLQVVRARLFQPPHWTPLQPGMPIRALVERCGGEEVRVQGLQDGTRLLQPPCSLMH